MPTPPARSVRATLRHRWPALLLLAVAVLLAGAAPGTVAARNAAVAAAELRSAVDLLPADERALRVTTSSADDRVAQAASATAAAAAEGARLGPTTVLTARFTYPLTAMGGSLPAGTEVVLATSPDWPGRVEVVDGRLPAQAGVVEVLAPRASTLAVGDEVLVGTRATPARVVGTWRPRDADDPFWFADPGLAAGTLSDRDGAVGPLFVVDDAVVDALAERPLVRWTVVPGLADTSAAALGHVAEALAALPQALREAGALVQGATVDDDAATTLAALAASGDAERELGGPPTVLAGAAGVLAVLAAAWAVAARTARERAVLTARGGSARALVRREAPAVLGAGVLGMAGAVAVAAAAAGGSGMAGTVVWAGGTAALGCAASLTLASRARPVGGRTTLPGRLPSPGLAAVLGVVAVLAAVCTWSAVQAGTAGGPDAADAVGPLGAARPAAAALLLVLVGALVAVVARAVRPAIGHGVITTGGALALAAGAAALTLAGPPGSAVRGTWTAAVPAALAALVVVVVAGLAATRWDPGRDAPHLRRRRTGPAPVLVTAALLMLAGGWLTGSTLAGLVLGGVAR
jgi:hypothetical protein